MPSCTKSTFRGAADEARRIAMEYGCNVSVRRSGSGWEAVRSDGGSSGAVCITAVDTGREQPVCWSGPHIPWPYEAELAALELQTAKQEAWSQAQREKQREEDAKREKQWSSPRVVHTPRPGSAPVPTDVLLSLPVPSSGAGQTISPALMSGDVVYGD